MSDTLGEALPKEMKRVRELSQVYAEIGISGVWALGQMKEILIETEVAIMEQDIGKMMSCFKSLQEFTD